MMIGHISFAGLAELFITGGMMAYLQRANPELLAYSATRLAPDAGSGWKSTRALWFGLSGLMILSPLGLLAAGTAWGEWGVDDFASTTVREEIVRAFR